MKNLFILAIFGCCQINAQTPNYPFPQHVQYTSGTIKPNNYSQNTLDNHVKKFYDKWRDRYVLAGCTAGEYYIWFNDLGGNGNNICVSEGQGYGMVIVALMAGYDPNAKTYFDGLYHWYKSHPSTINPLLMNWRQKNPGCVSNGDDSAIDGDLDIAYGLLLADKQWGSGGDINYFQEANNIIGAIMQSEIYASVYSTQLGDWAHTDGFYKDGTRPSDFMCDHFRSFKDATGEANWNNVLDQCYELISDMQTNYSSTTGLLPDFIQDTDGNPVPAQANYLEGPYDGAYNYNACRVPWRLATDYLLNGDVRAKNACDKINSWIKTKTGNNVNNIRSGYYLNGNNLPGNNYQDLAFVAPFGVSAMTNAANQSWLNDLWNNVKAVKLNRDGYYGNTIKMQAMLVISGNWWAPQKVLKAGATPSAIISAPKSVGINVFPNPAFNSCELVFDWDESTIGQLTIVNCIGERTFTGSLAINSGENHVAVDLLNMQAGSYLVIIENGTTKNFGRIVVSQQ